MAFVVKFTHLEQTLFVHSHRLFYSLKRCLELFLWRKERIITLWNATWFENLQIDFHLEDKSVLKIHLAPFWQEEALSDNVMRNNMLIDFGY